MTFTRLTVASCLQSDSISAWHMKDLFLDSVTLVPVRWKQIQLSSRNLDIDICVGNSLVYSCTKNLSVPPPKRRDKGGSQKNRAIGICRYRPWEGFRRLLFCLEVIQEQNHLKHPSTDSVSIISSLATHPKNLACPKSLLADAARSPQRSVRLVTLLYASWISLP